MQLQEGIGEEMTAEVGGTLCHHFCVAAGTKEDRGQQRWVQPITIMLTWLWKCGGGAEMTAIVGGMLSHHVCAVVGRCRGRNDDGGRCTSLSLLCGHRNKGQ